MRNSRFTGINWQDAGKRLLFLTTGALIGAVGVVIFLIPADLAPPGVTGLATILNELIQTPIGLMVILFNIPIQMIGFRALGGMKVVLGTIYYTVVFSLAVDLLLPVLGTAPVSDNLLLMAVFGGVLQGIGGGLVYRADGTMGGTSTLARVLQQRFGIPLSASALYTDTFVMLAAGTVFGWEAALCAMVSMFVLGAVSDYVLEGPSVVRTATIVTDQPDVVANAIETCLKRSATRWSGEGARTQVDHAVLYVAVSRPEVKMLHTAIGAADPAAFIVIGHGHTAYGGGFKAINRPKVVADARA
jgi:uncharacterized membrane-anchored protein YitT (DUF2179 family)